MRIAVITLCIFVLYRVQGMVYRRLWSRNLEVLIRFQKAQATEGESVILEEILENHKWLPLPVVFLQFKMSKFFKVAGEPTVVSDDRYTRNEMMSVMMNQRLRRKVEVVCTKRGNYTIERASVGAQSLFLDEKYMLEIDCESKLAVYPRMVDTRRFEQLLRSVGGGQLLRPFMQEDPFLLRGVREYQIYDSMKWINWNATAKTGSLKVNLLETVASQQAFVFLNVQKESLAVHNEVIEESIRLAKTFCAVFSKRGMKSQLYTNGTDGKSREPVCVEKGVGVEYMSRVNEALTRIFVDETGNILTYGRDAELDFVEMYADAVEEASQEGQVILISGHQGTEVMKMLKRLHRKGRAFLWIVPVEKTAAYKKNEELKGHMRLWRLNFEGAGGADAHRTEEAV